MDQQKASLIVSLHNVEFSKEYHYFLTVQLESDGEKRRTDISACVSNPVFTASVFVIPLSNFKIDINEKLHFAAFVVTDREEGVASKDIDNKGQSRLLGECTLPLGPLTEVLTDISGTGVRQSLKFIRQFNNELKTVGRFIVNLKLVGEQVIPIEEKDFKPLERDEIIHELPRADPFFNFAWRIRVDIRSGIDLPLNRVNPSGLPTSFVETGWTLYDNQIPDDFGLYLTNLVENNRHPYWNQQFLITNPETMQNKEGFIYICIKDKYISESIDTFYLPVFPLRPFIPYNFEFISQKAEYEAKPKYYISICLEMPNKDSFLDALTDIAVHNIQFDPLPYTNRMFLCMSLNVHRPAQVPFIKFELTGPSNLAKIIQDNSNEHNAFFISSLMKIPPYQTDHVYRAVAVFTLPKSYLDKSISFFVAGRDDSLPCAHGMPNGIVGNSEIADDVLKKLYFAKDKKQAFIPVMWRKDSKLYPVFSTTKCLLELGCFSEEESKKMHVQDQEGLAQQANQTGSAGGEKPQTPEDKLAKMMGKKFDSGIEQGDKWGVLAKELSQKQEVFHRLIKEIDDKTESLKITGAEIIDLRRQIKLLQSENSILRKRLAAEEQLEVQSIVTKEIAMMNTEELRNKILKLASAYRDERIRNEEFDKALKNAQKEISQARQIQHELEILQKKHGENAKKLILMQTEVQKTQVYKETIKKQEKVISKFEKLLETTLKDTQKARNAQLELEQLRTENLQLQKQMSSGFGGDTDQIEKMRQEINRLEKVNADLREELKSKRPVSSQGAQWEQEKIELEIKLHKNQSRVEALQDEMTNNAKNYAKEIAHLKLIIAEKQAMLDTLTLGI